MSSAVREEILFPQPLPQPILPYKNKNNQNKSYQNIERITRVYSNRSEYYCQS